MTSTVKTAKPYHLSHPQAVAWVILLAGFVVFCALSVSGAAFAHWFLFESQIDMDMTLAVSRGRVDIRLPDGTSTVIGRTERVGANTLFLLDSGTQGQVIIQDNYAERVIATLYLLQESTITLNNGVRPRFEWSSGGYEISFGAAAGRFAVEIPPNLAHPLRMTIRTPSGEARFSQAGKFRLEVVEGRTILTAWEGVAALYAVNGGESPVSSGQFIIAQGENENAQVFAAQGVNDELLNANFGSLSDIETNSALPIGWACTSQANKQNEPQGAIGRTLYNNAVVLRMRRIGEGLDHAESRCSYTFGLTPDIPLDVTGYASLSLRAAIKIRLQDVTTCGIRGSECPVMLELEYLAKGNTPNEPQFWRHGFYALRPPVDSNPLICDTCLQDHEKLTPDTWYLYDSGDLLSLLPENKRPEKIIRLKVYASGHAYDAVVADLALVGRR